MAAGMVGAAAMAVQNAGARLVLSGLAPTTVMTGNVTQWVIDAVDLARGAGDDAVRERARKFIAPIVAFAAGAIVGAFGYVHVGFAALLLPIAVLGGLSWAVGPRSGQLDAADQVFQPRNTYEKESKEGKATRRARRGSAAAPPRDADRPRRMRPRTSRRR